MMESRMGRGLVQCGRDFRRLGVLLHLVVVGVSVRASPSGMWAELSPLRVLQTQQRTVRGTEPTSTSSYEP